MGIEPTTYALREHRGPAHEALTRPDATTRRTHRTRVTWANTRRVPRLVPRRWSRTGPPSHDGNLQRLGGVAFGRTTLTGVESPYAEATSTPASTTSAASSPGRVFTGDEAIRSPSRRRWAQATTRCRRGWLRCCGGRRGPTRPSKFTESRDLRDSVLGAMADIQGRETSAPTASSATAARATGSCSTSPGCSTVGRWRSRPPTVWPRSQASGSRVGWATEAEVMWVRADVVRLRLVGRVDDVEAAMTTVGSRRLS